MGFFKALFDFEFNYFVTPKIVKFVYVILTVLILIGALISLMIALFTESLMLILLSLVAVPLVAIVYLGLARKSLELYSR